MRYACLLFAALLVSVEARGQALLHDTPDATGNSPSVVKTPPSTGTQTVLPEGMEIS